MIGIDGVKSITVFDTEYFTKYGAYNVYIERNVDGMPKKLDACILVHIAEETLIFCYLPDNDGGGRNFQVSLHDYVESNVKITKLVPCDGIDTRLTYSADSSSESPHFDNDEFVGVFDEVFGKDRRTCIEALIMHNAGTFKTDSFILSYSPCHEYYIIDTNRCVVVGWYPVYGYKYNTCSHRDFTLDNLRLMLQLLHEELNELQPDGWVALENKINSEEK